MRSAHPHVQRCWCKPLGESGGPLNPRAAAFRTWAHGVARRRGTKVAMVALARRLARTMFAMWRDETDFEPARIQIGRSNGHATMATTAAVPMQFSEVVKLEEQARILVWLFFESRASEGAAPPSTPPVRRHVTRATRERE